MYIVFSGFLRILSAPSGQSCCTLWITASYRVFVDGRYRKSRIVLCVVVGPGFVSTSPVFIRSRVSHPADPHGWLVQKTVNRAPISRGGRFGHNLHSSL